VQDAKALQWLSPHPLLTYLPKAKNGTGVTPDEYRRLCPWA